MLVFDLPSWHLFLFAGADRLHWLAVRAGHVWHRWANERLECDVRGNALRGWVLWPQRINFIRHCVMHSVPIGHVLDLPWKHFMQRESVRLGHVRPAREHKRNSCHLYRNSLW